MSHCSVYDCYHSFFSQPSEGLANEKFFLSKTDFSSIHSARTHIACYILSQRLQINWADEKMFEKQPLKRHRQVLPDRIQMFVVVHIGTFQYKYIEMKCEEKSFVWKSEYMHEKKYNYERVSVWYKTWISKLRTLSCVCLYEFLLHIWFALMCRSALNTQTARTYAFSYTLLSSCFTPEK